MFQSNKLPLNRKIDSKFDDQKLVKIPIFKTPKLYKKSSQVYNLSSAQVFKSFTMAIIINEVPSKKKTVGNLKVCVNISHVLLF